MPASVIDWTTPAEAVQFRTTPSYGDTLAYLRRLHQAAPGQVRVETFGISPEGRLMTAVIASSDGTFSPELARTARKAVVLVQVAAHAGEVAGKDAGLMLLRDFAVAGKLPHLLDHVVLVFIPVFNVDGHEDTAPRMRIDQNGPEQQGSRCQSQHLDLDLDYLKADTPEMRAWLELWQRWQPDLLVDINGNSGPDHQYDLTWHAVDIQELAPAVGEWLHETMADQVLPALAERGRRTSIQLDFKDPDDPRKGIARIASGRRQATGFAALENRPALSIRVNPQAPYAQRAAVVHDLLSILIDYINRHPDPLLLATTRADAAAFAPGQPVTLRYKTGPRTEPFHFEGYARSVHASNISGQGWTRHDRRQPQSIVIPKAIELLPDIEVVIPAAYVMPPQWHAIVERLEAHAIEYRRLDRSVAVAAEHYQLDDPAWFTQPFEGRMPLTAFTGARHTGQVMLHAGSVLVALDQRHARVAMELLEPWTPESLLRWGFFNAIFERKETINANVLEHLARDMLKSDPTLQATFESWLASDPAFAADAEARLDFFYQRSPRYIAQRIGTYPVLRLDTEALKQLQAGRDLV